MPETTPARLAGAIYDLVYNEEDARACREIPESACREAPRNFVVLLFSYFLTKLGDAVANPKTVLSWVMTSVGAPVYLLGFLVPIRESGSLIPQLVIAGFVRRLAVRKWVWVAGSVLQAAALTGIGAVALVSTGTVAGFSIIALLTVFSLARGLCSVAAKDVLGKTIDKGRRGRLTGWSASAAGLVTIGLGALLVTTAGETGTHAYGIALMVAAGLWIVAAASYSRVVELPGETSGGENAIAEAVKRLSILVADAPFRRFVITRSLLLCSALTAPYFVALGQARMGTAAFVLGSFVIASGMANLLGAPVWGLFADRSSRRVMIAAATFTALTALAVAVVDTFACAVTGSVWFLPLAYFFLSLAHSGVRVARKTYIVDLARGNRRTDYVAVSNSVIGVVLLGTGFIGTLASVISFSGVIVALALMGIAGALMARQLPEV